MLFHWALDVERPWNVWKLCDKAIRAKSPAITDS